MILPNFNRTGMGEGAGGARTAPAQQGEQQAPARQQGGGQQEQEAVEWTRGWKLPENSGGRVAPQEFIGRLHQTEGVGRLGKTFGNQRREFLILNFDWLFVMQMREGMTFDAEEGLRLEIPVSGSEQSGMGMFRASVAQLTGIAAVNKMLQEKLWEFQDNVQMMHLVSVDDYQYTDRDGSPAVGRDGKPMKGMIWQMVDLYIEGDDGVLWSTVRGEATPTPTSMFDAVNELALTAPPEQPEQPEQPNVPAVNQLSMPDFSQYDWSEEHTLASAENGCLWTVIRSYVREKHKADSSIANSLFAVSNGFPSALLEYFIVNDIMRKISEDGDPIQLIAVPGALD